MTARTPSRRFLDFLRAESAGSWLLLAATVLALAWVNLPLGDSYRAFVEAPLPIDRLPDLRHLVNDGLMALFFLVVGLEIKRELRGGELSSWKVAALPVVAATGGMVVPALAYVALNTGTEGSAGWGIPMATDIAFAVGVIAAFGARVPTGAKVFLLSLAIADDIGAILVIALFYAQGIEISWCLAAAAVVIVLGTIGRRWGARAPLAVYALGGIALWAAMLFSGIHPAISGVLVAVLIPSEGRAGSSPAQRAETSVHPWSSLLVVPLFALTNAGAEIDAAALQDAFTSRVGLGVAIGLVLGKLVGVSAFSWLAVKSKVAVLPEATSWSHIVALAAIAGIGFTVSLFVTELSFADPALIDRARLGVLGGSVIAAVIGAGTLYRSTRA